MYVWPAVVVMTVIGDETTHGSDLRGSSLSVLETIAPFETVLDPIPEDDDPDVVHKAGVNKLRPPEGREIRSGPFVTSSSTSLRAGLPSAVGSVWTFQEI